MEKRKEKKEKKNRKITYISSKLIYKFPLLLLISLLTFAVVQKIGELIGIFPVIYLVGNNFGSEEVIFFIISISFSIMIAYIFTNYILLIVDKK